jgi:hypothetical protein
MVECGAHLFQGRFGCVAMDETHCLNAVRYLVRYRALRGALRGDTGDTGTWRYGDMIRIALTFSPDSEQWAVSPASSFPIFPIT